MLQKIAKLYKRVRCTESEVYFAACEAAHKLQPTQESAAGCASMAAKKGVTLVIENHFNTMTMSARQTADTILEIGHPNVKILYDQANLTFTGNEDWQEATEIQKGLVGHMHVKDLVFKGQNRAFVGNDDVSHPDEDSRNVITRIVGEGIIEWPEILRRMKADGYDGWLSLEYERRWHPDDIPDASIGMKKSADYLKSITL